MLDRGFLIVEKYESLYEKYKARYKLTSDCYAMPRVDRLPQEYKIKYRGIERDCLTPNDVNPRNLAEIRLSELESQKRFGHDDIFYDEIYPVLSFIDMNLLDEMYSWLEDDKSKFETIFVKKAEISCEIPDLYKSAGFDPSYFYKDHFSASCDCMLIPRWHGTDEEGTLFLKYFKQLNSFGLFNSIENAKEFLEYYLSFEWTERGEFYITEVFLNEEDINA